jgi:hypothetical protein
MGDWLGHYRISTINRVYGRKTIWRRCIIYLLTAGCSEYFLLVIHKIHPKITLFSFGWKTTFKLLKWTLINVILKSLFFTLLTKHHVMMNNKQNQTLFFLLLQILPIRLRVILFLTLHHIRSQSLLLLNESFEKNSLPNDIRIRERKWTIPWKSSIL